MNNIPKEIIIKRKDFETMPQMIIVVVYVMIFITFLFFSGVIVGYSVSDRSRNIRISSILDSSKAI